MSVTVPGAPVLAACGPAPVPVRGEGGMLVRRAGPGDRAALEAMFQRCSPQTVYRRFHGHLRAFPGRFLAQAVAGVPEHFALVACRGSRVVAMANCCLADPEPGGGASAGELGVLVEDEFQRHGLGRVLLAGLVVHARELGLATLQAQVLNEQDWILGLLGEFGRCESGFQRGVREVTLHLDRVDRVGLR